MLTNTRFAAAHPGDHTRRQIPIIAWLSAAVIISFSLTCRAEQGDVIYAGDTVTVIAEHVEFGLRDQTATTLSAGDKIHVTEVRGVWIGGYAWKNGEKYTGWVEQPEIRLVVISPDDVQRIETPDVPDDPDAIARLRELNVTLELNDKNAVHTVDGTESEIEDDAMASLRGLHQLASLDLSGRPISDKGLRDLGASKVLQEVYLGDAAITDAGLEYVKQFPNLEILSLQGTKVTGPGLQHLQHLKDLRVLNLSNCVLSDDALAHLEKMAKLEVLALNGTKITNEGLAHLKPLTRLRVLNIIGCDVDDRGLAHLTGLEQLRMLYVAKTQITWQGSEELNESLPSLAIFD